MCTGNLASNLTVSDQSRWRNMWSIYQLNCNSTTSYEPQPVEHRSLDHGVLKYNTALSTNCKWIWQPVI